MARNSQRGRRWQRLRVAVLNARGWRCERCGGTGRLEVHHRVRIADGGDRWNPDNLEALCRRCHFGHHRAESPRAEWMDRLDEYL